MENLFARLLGGGGLFGGGGASGSWEANSIPPPLPPPKIPPIVKPPASGTNDGQAGSGALPEPPPPPIVNVTNTIGNKLVADTRVKIRVPTKYFTPYTSGSNGELQNLEAIIFPYTPTVSQEYKADYSAQTPIHSNYTQYFYKNSSVGPITITGKFSVQNDSDAGVYLATVHLLRALTKMRWGNDPDAGSPPPVCRLDAWGEYMFNNVPVAINSFRLELPNGVDYFTPNKSSESFYGLYKKTKVPTLSEISVTCIPIYSRQEILNYNVTEYLNGSLNNKGYL